MTQTDQTSISNKSRRVTVDLTPAAAAEVDRIREVTGLSTADIFRHAFTLLRIYVDERQADREFRIVEKGDDRVQTRLELPIHVSKAQ